MRNSRKSKGKSRSLLVLLPYAKAYRGKLAWAFVFVVAVVAIDLVQPWIVKEVIDRFASNSLPDSASLIALSAGYLGLTVLSFGLTWLQELLLQDAGLSIVKTLRTDLFRHIQSLSLSYFDRNNAGRIITNVANDTETLNTFFTQFLANTLRGGISLLLIMAFMTKLNGRIALYCFLLLPTVILTAAFFQQRLQSANAEARRRLGALISYLAENLGGMRIVQIFHQEAKQQRRMDEHNRSYFNASVEENRRFLIFFNVTELLADLTVAALVWFGGYGVIKGTISFGVLYAFVGYIRRFFQPVSMMLFQMNTLQSAIVASSRIGDILAESPDIVEAEKARVVSPVGCIRFDKVCFAYRPGHQVLHEIDLTIKPGERVGFVGATGAGKSSIMNLVTRFYDVTSGMVSIDGVDIRDWPLEQLRHTVGIVQQDVTLFFGTVIDNVRFFRNDIADEEVISACRLAGADALIRRLPQGYETLLSERGSTLSAGERQLLSFARVLLFDPRILILDEATSNLDSGTEEVLQQSVHRVSEGRTLLVIAHRLSTVQEMDTICVLDQGRIVEKGTHHELLEKDGYYRKLYRSSMHLETAA
ncbi:MAG: ABC transporter ATP-binding protein [Chlorobaculum sp.]|nr:ABC transporter ATP-binding protein [Chlorobaculum sp.]